VTLVVGIASAGRAAVLGHTLRGLEHQSCRPDRILVSTPAPRDLPAGLTEVGGVGIERLAAGPGLTRQRNAILESLAPGDIVAFLDDDFVPATDFLEVAERLFSLYPDVVVATGRVLADGIKGPGIGHAAATALLSRAPPPEGILADVPDAYGCNMVVRVPPPGGPRFDEALPLYGWLEDVDFSRRMASHGRVVWTDALRGVHLGVKIGRSPGVRLGYAQIANPCYLARKGTLARLRAARLMGGNIAANLVRSVAPEPWVDRRGRLRGNLLAMADLARRRLAPGRILDLEP